MKRCLEKEKLQRLSRSVGTSSSPLIFTSIGSTRAGDSEISFGLMVASLRFTYSASSFDVVITWWNDAEMSP